MHILALQQRLQGVTVSPVIGHQDHAQLLVIYFYLFLFISICSVQEWLSSCSTEFQSSTIRSDLTWPTIQSYYCSIECCPWEIKMWNEVEAHNLILFVTFKWTSNIWRRAISLLLNWYVARGIFDVRREFGKFGNPTHASGTTAPCQSPAACGAHGLRQNGWLRR